MGVDKRDQTPSEGKKKKIKLKKTVFGLFLSAR